MIPHVLLFSLPAVTLSASPWTARQDMIRKRGEHANFVYQGEIYVLGGIHNHTSGPAHIEKYNPATDSWTHVGEMSLQRHHVTCGSSVDGTEVWVCGGKLNNGTYTKRVDVYNVKDNTWRRGPDLPQKHWGGPSVVCGDRLHVLSGAKDNNTTRDHHYVLDLENDSAGWSSLKAVPEPRVHAAGVCLNGKVYLIGGEYHHTHDGDTKTMQVYDPHTNAWDLTKARLPEARSHHEWATFVHDGTIWSVSGVDSKNDPRGQATMYVYDPDTDSWTGKQNLWARLCSPGAKVLDNTLYVFGGGVDDWFGGDMVTTKALALSSEPRPNDTLDAFARIEAEDYDSQSSLGIYDGGSGQKIGSIEDGAWARYADVDFGDGATGFTARVASNTSGGTIELVLDSLDGTLIGSCPVPGTGGWNEFVTKSAPCEVSGGVHDLYLKFTGGSGLLLDVDHFVFDKGSTGAKEGTRRVSFTRTPSDFTSPTTVFSVNGRKIGLMSGHTGNAAAKRSWHTAGVGSAIILYPHGAMRKTMVLE